MAELIDSASNTYILNKISAPATGGEYLGPQKPVSDKSCINPLTWCAHPHHTNNQEETTTTSFLLGFFLLRILLKLNI
jgi:hypothetical protein